MDSKSVEVPTCPICYEIFKIPVFLSCSHSICKECLQQFWKTKETQECPVCRRRSSKGEPPVNLELKNLCDSLIKERNERRSSESEEICSLHSEKLKLFCLEDKQPVCLVCRDSEKHTKHTFRPISEVVSSYKENTDRELQEQRRVARERENVQKRRSLALCTGLEAERESDELEHALQRSLSYTGSRRSLRRLSQYFLRSSERNITPDVQQQPNSALSRDSALTRHSLHKNDEDELKQAPCLSLHGDAMDSPNTMRSNCRLNTRTVPRDDAFVALGQTSIASHQQGAVNVLPLTGLSSNNVLKVEKLVQDASERLTQMPDAPADAEKKDCVSGKASQRGAAPQTNTSSWVKATPPAESSPLLSQEPCGVIYPRVGETLECHTLVKGLRSYESLSPTATRPATNHCSKWKKEREAEERDGAGSPHAKDDSRLLKSPTRGQSKRHLVPRGAPSNYSGIPRVPTKAEPTPADSLSASRVSRTSLMSRFTSVQNELKRNSGARQKVNAPSDAGKPKGHAPERSRQDEDKRREQFVRGSPLRVSKRLAPNSPAPHPIHSPTAATTAKTIRTAIISAAKAKTSKTPGSRIPGPKIPRPAAQPMWR